MNTLLPVARQCFVIDDLHPQTALKYDAYTFPKLRQRWAENTPRGKLMAAIASLGGELLGMAIAECNEARQTADLISFYVAPTYRCQGIGQDLLQQLEHALKEQGYLSLSLTYRSDWPNLAGIETILRKRCWDVPKATRLACRTDARLLHANWFQSYKLPPGFSIFPWVELSAEEQQSIQDQQEQQTWYPDALSPFQDVHSIEPLNSLGLRHYDNVVGWMITHRASPDTIVYSSLFVDQHLQHLGRAIPLLVEAIRLQHQSSIPYGIFLVDVDNAPMMNFVSRRLAPYLTTYTYHRYCMKPL